MKQFKVAAFAIVLGLGGCAEESTSPLADAEQAVSTAVSGSVTATLTTTSDWGAGFCDSVTIVNKGSAVTNWTAKIATNGATIDNIWSASQTTSGTVMTVTPAAHNQSIPGGGSVSFGYCGTGTKRPTLTSITVSGGGGGTGGSSATGGTSAKGGTTAAGGTKATGGTSAKGGTTAAGGTKATGGTSAKGGTTAAGGTKATGGTTAKGGTTAAGGNSGTCPVSLVGWAATGSGTTGGGNLTPVVVTTIAALRDAVSGSAARVVHLSGTVDTGSSAIAMGSNKTLRGVDKNAKIIGGITIKGQSNIIIQNLTVQGKGAGATPVDSVAASGSHHMWFDHLNILDGGDGILDLTNGSDHATVSWCKFYYTKSHSHMLALLFGNGSEKCDIDAGKNNHTVHHNWFSTLVNQRMPRILFGKGHVYNNYYNSPGNGYCVGAGSWASVLVENNYFKSVASPHKFQDGHPSYIAAKGNVYDQTTGSKDTGLGGSDGPSTACERGLGVPGPWTPSYAYQLDAAAAVPDLVMKCAGPQ